MVSRQRRREHGPGHETMFVERERQELCLRKEGGALVTVEPSVVLVGRIPLRGLAVPRSVMALSLVTPVVRLLAGRGAQHLVRLREVGGEVPPVADGRAGKDEAIGHEHTARKHTAQGRAPT